jgi:hypothetical protein
MIRFLSHPALQGAGVLLAFVTAALSVFMHLHQTQAVTERKPNDGDAFDQESEFAHQTVAVREKLDQAGKRIYLTDEAPSAASPRVFTNLSPSSGRRNIAFRWLRSRNGGVAARIAALILVISFAVLVLHYLAGRPEYLVYVAVLMSGLGLILGIGTGLKYPDVGLFTFLLGGIVFVLCSPFLIGLGGGGIAFASGTAFFLLSSFIASNSKL